MDQLLNAGVGYGYNMPPIKDPDDNRTDDERFRDGCLTAIIEFVVLVVLLSLFACFSSCTTSRNMCGVTTSEGDSLTQYIEQSVSVAKQDTSASHTATVFNSSAVESTTADETETETITEQIMVTTDSLGRTTTTTNRTTTRQRKTTNATTSQQRQQSIVDVWQQYMAYMDSVYQAENLTSFTQWSDSTYHHQDKQVDSAPSTLAKVLSSIWDVLVFFSVAYVIAYILYMVMKYWPEKK